jgi:flagellar biosynthetic protein FlhB
MAGEKSEKATPKKRRDSRKEGEVLKSQEITNSMTMFGGLLAMAVLWRSMMDNLMDFYINMFRNGYAVYGALGINNISEIFSVMARTLFLVAGPIIFLILLSGLVINYVQVGVLFTPKSIQPKGNRISMIEGFKRMFSVKTLMNLVKSLLKVAAFLLIGYLTIEPLFQATSGLVHEDLLQAIEYGASQMLSLATKLLIAMVLVSVVDYIFQWFEFEKKLKMSKQEVKDEHKNTEGNPEIKSRIRRIQTEMSMSRMMQVLPTADVVITNPTHFAIALKYDNEKHNAPVVVARGADNIAKKIKDKAKEHKIEIVENKELAQTLYKVTRVGDQIPIELFDAVAEVLAYVYKIRELHCKIKLATKSKSIKESCVPVL